MHKADLLFLDSPVGSGFSYVESTSLLTENLQQITDDMVAWARLWFADHQRFQSRPFFVVGQSYGAKLATAFGGALYDVCSTLNAAA